MLGFLGPGPIAPHVEHALGFAEAAGITPAMAVDLGSGGGVPGLPLALGWPSSRWLLVEAMERRAQFLHDAVAALDLAGRVEVAAARSEVVGRDPAWRARAALVVSRSFGPPAVVAEAAAPLLDVGGLLVVSEPPDERERWPADGLAALGMGEPARRGRYVCIAQVVLCPDRYPRRTGVPSKRPLW